MAVTVYRSTDASAPTLNGTASSLVSVLDACLVNGYGALPAAGWAKAFSATNLGVYRAPIGAGSRMFLRVDDSGSTEARISGYEVMTAVSTGTGQFPTNAQQSGGLYVRKSDTSDSVARPWMLVATDRSFYFFPISGGSDWNVAHTYTFLAGQFFFGDIVSFKPGDAYNCLIIGAIATGSSSNQMGNSSRSTSFIICSGHFMPRSHLQIGNSIQVGKMPSNDTMSTISSIGSESAAGYSPFPDSVSGGLLLSSVSVVEGVDTGTRIGVRGLMPGLWAPLHPRPGQHADLITGSGDMAGKTFQLVNTSNSTNNGRLAIEISDTW